MAWRGQHAQLTDALVLKSLNGELYHEITRINQVNQTKRNLKRLYPEELFFITMGPLQLAVTWYKIHHAGEQATHWDIQNKENANLS